MQINFLFPAAILRIIFGSHKFSIRKSKHIAIFVFLDSLPKAFF